MRILASQIHIPAIDTREKQIAHVKALISRLDTCVKSNPVDLVVLPELTTIEYSAANFQNVDRFSEGLYGETFELFSKFCRDNSVAACYGMPRKEGADTYISQIALGR